MFVQSFKVLRLLGQGVHHLYLLCLVYQGIEHQFYGQNGIAAVSPFFVMYDQLFIQGEELEDGSLPFLK